MLKGHCVEWDGRRAMHPIVVAGLSLANVALVGVLACLAVAAWALWCDWDTGR